MCHRTDLDILAMSKKPIERFFTPAGESSLIIARCDAKDSTCLLEDLATRDDKEEFHLSVDQYALKSTPGAQQILVNFESAHGELSQLRLCATSTETARS